jgi:hypothetical protein
VKPLLFIGLLLTCGACGRIGFEPTGTSSSSPDAVTTGDAAMVNCLDSAAALTCTGSVQLNACNGKCFVTCSDLVTADDALSRCRQEPGRQSATIRDMADESCLVSITTAETWMGLRQNSSALAPGFNWSWVDGTPTSYLNWGGLQPDDADSVENQQEQCATMTTNGTLFDRSCTVLHTIACSH